MSTDYDVRCKTCGSHHGFDNANHAHDLMRTLIRHREAIAALAPLMNEVGSEVEFRIYCQSSIDPSWFADHAGHELAVFDEYGGEFGTCREYYSCDHCKARHFCDLPIGHTEPHGKVTP